MMIRINLLPVRQVQKREMGRQYLVIAVGFTVLSALGNYVWFASRDGEAQKQRRVTSDTEARIAQLEKTIGEVNKLNQRKKEVQEKLTILERLRKQRNGPVRMLDALATCIPRKVSISDFVESSAAVQVRGAGQSYEDVSEFMKALGGIVWTPKGIARVVERKREATTARVELLTGEGTMEDYALAEIANFFTGVELKSTQSASSGAVSFEIHMATNYAI